MEKTVLDLLEKAAGKWPERTAYEDENNAITFSEVLNLAKKVGTKIAGLSGSHKPVVVWSTKSVYAPSIFMGVLYSGNYYAPISEDVPAQRVKTIIEHVKPDIIAVDGIDDVLVKELNFKGTIVRISDCNKIDEQLLKTRAEDIIDSDPQLIIFTSGSTGIPKSVLITYHNVIDMMTEFTQIFNINSDTIIGGQPPFNYVSGVRGIFFPFLTGCKTVLVQKSYFTNPVKLINYINEKQVNYLDWTAASFSLLHNFNTFSQIKPKYVTKIISMGGVYNLKI